MQVSQVVPQNVEVEKRGAGAQNNNNNNNQKPGHPIATAVKVVITAGEIQNQESEQEPGGEAAGAAEAKMEGGEERVNVLKVSHCMANPSF